ncbi:hypothetical protein L7F22_014230 [Adiantum nelumboides]|nr:hypothetical protein [Adiantum nelumboides]
MPENNSYQISINMEIKKANKKQKQVDLSSFYKAIETKSKTKERELQKARENVMEELFEDGTELGQDDNEDAQEAQLATSVEPPSKVKKQRRWIPAWKLQHCWAYPVIFEGKVRVKCEWCVYSKQNTPYAKNGSSTLQLPALTEHSKTNEHKNAMFKWANKEKRICIPLPDYMAALEDKEKMMVEQKQSTMLSLRSGLIARLRVDVPHVLLVHCLAHRKNLAASQAVDSFSELVNLDKLCRSVYNWLHALGKRMDDLKFIESALDLKELAMLRIHSIRKRKLRSCARRAICTIDTDWEIHSDGSDAGGGDAGEALDDDIGVAVEFEEEEEDEETDLDEV